MRGHNSRGLSIQIEVRLFNSISRYADGAGAHQLLEVPAGTTVGDILALFRIPEEDVFLVFVDGRDITRKLNGVRATFEVEDGAVVSLSGPVPYSYGYGAPVV